MKTSQKRAIWYEDRKRKLKKIDSLGLWDEYLAFISGKKNNQIERFCAKKGIRI